MSSCALPGSLSSDSGWRVSPVTLLFDCDRRGKAAVSTSRAIFAAKELSEAAGIYQVRATVQQDSGISDVCPTRSPNMFAHKRPAALPGVRPTS